MLFRSWKDQHASLLSFSGDAYLNEMGITTRLFPDEVTKLCNAAPEPNDTPGADGLDDLDHFARFIRASWYSVFIFFFAFGLSILGAPVCASGRKQIHNKPGTLSSVRRGPLLPASRCSQ